MSVEVLAAAGACQERPRLTQTPLHLLRFSVS